MTQTIEKITTQGIGFAPGKYDPTALIGLLVMVAPGIIDEILSSGDLELVPWAKWGLRIAGACLAAYGRSVVVRTPPEQDA